MANPAVVEVGGIAEPIVATQSVTAPGVGATVVTTAAAPPAGVYQIRAKLILTGTAETQLLNGLLVANSGTFQLTIPSLTGSGFEDIVIPRLTLNGINVVKIQVIAAATAGAIYTGMLILTRVE